MRRRSNCCRSDQRILLTNEALEATESCSEGLQDVGRSETVSGGVVCGVDWVHDYKHLLVDLR